MKWSLFELEKINQINETIARYDVPEGYSDVDSISNIQVSGPVIHENSEVHILLNVKAELIMLCAFTLKEVEVMLNFQLDLIFGNSVDADYELTNPLELDDIVLGNILTEKPYRVFHKTADRSLFEPKPEVHPAFAELDELLKE